MKQNRNIFLFIISFLFLCLFNGVVTAQTTNESNLSKKQRMQWWKDATFGMFIHWGIYAVPGHGEWYMHVGRIPVKKYEKYAAQFNPHHFNADYWVRVAKNAGMKYLVITSKHHDGFSMFNTAATHYDVVDATPWKRDPLKEISEACRRHGITFGAYYSIMDWHTPYQLPKDNSNPDSPFYNNNRIKPGKKDDYIKYMKVQLQELIHQYHPAILWFDGYWPDWWTLNDGKELYDYLRNLDPELIINNRIGKRKTGDEMIADFGTPEQKIPPNGIPGSYWETCMTINKHWWGYDKNDHDFKSDTLLIRNLIDIASKGGNYLLNVGPTAQGTIPLPEVKRLAAIGHWLNINGEAIYATSASPFAEKFDWGRVTKGEHSLYLIIFNWPEEGAITLPAYPGKVVSAHLFEDPDRPGVAARREGNNIVVDLPGKAPNGIASVVELEFDEENN